MTVPRPGELRKALQASGEQVAGFLERDAWLTVLLWVAAAACTVGGVSQLASDASIVVRILVLALLLGVAALVLWILYGTHYTFTQDQLDVRSGPFRFRVPLAEVVSAEPSHKTRGPALLDRAVFQAAVMPASTA